MKFQNDYKLKNLRSISLRNLNLTTLIHDNHDTANKPDNFRPRRQSLNYKISTLENGGDNENDLIRLNRVKLLDTFFSLHLPGIESNENEEGLIYVSEVIQTNPNPNFGPISLPSLINNEGNQSVIMIKLWCRESSQFLLDQQWKLMCKLNIDLTKLVYVSSSFEDVDDDYFKDNSIVFQLNGRYHSLQTCLKDGKHHFQSENGNSKAESYSFDSIRSLSNLQKSLHELIRSKLKLAKQISHYVNSQKPRQLDDLNNLDQFKVPIKRLNRLIIKQRSTNDTQLSEIVSKRIKLNQYRQVVEEDFPQICKIGFNRLDIIESQMEPLNESLHQSVYPSIVSRLQEVCSVIQEMIMIDSLTNSIRYTIMGLEFPSTIKELLEVCYYNKHQLRNIHYDQVDQIPFIHHDDVQRPQYQEFQQQHETQIEQVNAGLSFIVQTLACLSEVTQAHLKYRMILNGNQCFIVDRVTSISNIDVEHQQRNQKYLELAGPQLKELYDDPSRMLLYPLYYDATMTERQGIDYYHSAAENNTRYLLKNVDFETGLKLLNKNLVLLINHVTDIYGSFYHGYDDGPDHKISDNIPIDCLDNFLWNIQYLILFITAPMALTGAKDDH